MAAGGPLDPRGFGGGRRLRFKLGGSRLSLTGAGGLGLSAQTSVKTPHLWIPPPTV